MTSITLLPTYFCATVKAEVPFSGFRYTKGVVENSGVEVCGSVSFKYTKGCLIIEMFWKEVPSFKFTWEMTRRLSVLGM